VTAACSAASPLLLLPPLPQQSPTVSLLLMFILPLAFGTLGTRHWKWDWVDYEACT
jgi:hypothetical protein